MTLGDVAMLSVQFLTNNAQVGGRIFDSYWHVRSLARFNGHPVLGDNPLVRTGDFRNAVWALSLSPSALWMCTASRESLRGIKNEKTTKLVKLVNSDQAVQAARYVFSTRHDDLGWLESRLRHTAESPPPPKKLILLDERVRRKAV